ncbi:DUF1516 family protein [Ammoniphilus resinae]|uniref:Uncharacterized protein n=1 Tax=Ammoniphilus resinae TaxID=861532 RepID=A0ABS4GN64_9BACL|nr:DUF1516 family protein [Ammoniphilus resinae]MBP1931727.1 hypothetical protein [Ammoniphilus resinae]
MSEKLINIFYQSHAGSWFFLILFFVISYILLSKGKVGAGRITQMLFRLFMLIMLISGIGMLIGFSFPLIYVIKGVLAVALIGIMEMLLGRVKRGEEGKTFWILFVVLLLLVLLIGFNVISF